ncbi:MAG: methyltransferase domain-containing protein [Planctomycetota bacterium]
MKLDEKKLEEFMGRAVGDFGATLNTILVVLGDRLGLYKAMAGAGPLTSAQLAERTELAERYVREWLAAQAAGGYVTYDARTGAYTLPPEQAMALADEQSHVYLQGGFNLCFSLMNDEAKIREAFRSGKGVGWHEHHPGLFEGTEKFFRPTYAAHLVGEWIPALNGTKESLERGARVADVGCGFGASTIIMAQAFPKSTFVGYDYHPLSIEKARERAKRAKVSDRVEFQISTAKEFPGKDYALITFFDCLHDMGDPAGAAAHAREGLRKDGALLVVEPLAGDRVEENLNPVGRVYYAASTLVCTPSSLAQERALGLGAQAGESRLAGVLREGGFAQVRRVAETPFNMVLEARV